MAVDETLLRGRAGIKPRSLSPSEISDNVRASVPEPENKPAVAEPEYQAPPKKSDPLPKPGDGYRAHARFLNRLGNEQRLIHFVTSDFVCEGFAYSDLRRLRWVPPADAGGSPVIELRFVEAVVTEVRIEGRNLEDIHYWISEGVMPWLWVQPRGLKPREDGVPVITHITMTEAEK